MVRGLTSSLIVRIKPVDARLEAISNSVEEINRNLLLLQGETEADEAISSINDFELKMHAVEQEMGE